MDNRYFSLFDMAIAIVPAFIFGIWQLVSINREIARDKRNAGDGGPGSAQEQSPSPQRTRHAVGKHRLDDR